MRLPNVPLLRRNSSRAGGILW